MMQIFRLRWLLLAFVFLLIGLTEVQGQTFFLRDTFCSNQLFIVNGHLYGPDNPNGTEILPGAAANGADSIIEVRLEFFQPATVLIKQNICGSDTLWVNNVPYHAHFTLGDETIEGGAANGCDSIIQVRLTAVPVPKTVISDSLCPDQSILVNGTRYNREHPAGLEILANAAINGCDSIVQVDLFFPDLQISLGDDQSSTIGDSICISPVLNFQPKNLEWSPALPCTQTDCFPVCQPFFSSIYVELIATDVTGCKVKDGIQVTVNKKVAVYIPSVFNPDANWPNNHFYLGTVSGVVRFKSFRIANRWGELIWQRENIQPNEPAEGWDGYWNGKIAPPGVYVFWAEYVLGNGQTELVSGSFALLR